MSPTPRLMFLLLIAALAASAAHAQVTTGTPPFASFGGGPDEVNFANLNSHITIPVIHKPGRGAFNFTYDLSYDSSVWYPVGASGSQTWQYVNNWGWRGVTEVATGYVSYNLWTGTCVGEDQRLHNYTVRDTWAYHDPFGAIHNFDNLVLVIDVGLCSGITQVNSDTATDGSGYSIINATQAHAPVYSSAGKVIVTPINQNSGTGSATDRNGNVISVNSSAQFFDTLSSATPVLTVAGSGTPATPTTFTYTAPSGATAAYSVQYTAYTVQTNFGCSGVTDFPATAENLVSEIDLPDYNQTTNPNSRYIFTYETTPNDTHNPPYVTGRLASVTLPTGGRISYTYTGGPTVGGVQTGIVCADGSTATLTRTTPDGTWTYAHSESGTAWTTLITDPQNNQTNMNFQGIYETQRQASQLINGSQSLLRQWTTCYNGNTSNCNTTVVGLPITQRTVTDQYGSTGLQSEHDYFYNSVAGLTEQDNYDYGSGASGSLLRKILVTYASMGNITAFRQTVTVCNGTGSAPRCNNSGTVVAQTNYNYDENTPTATSGIAQHTSVSGSRGNLTSINYPVSGLTSHFTYYDTGSLNTSQDVNGAQTTYNYSSTNNAYCQMAFPTSITEPVGTPAMTQSYTWNCTGGVQLTSTDENSQTTTTAYSDPDFWRPAFMTDQNNFTTNFCYGLLSSSTGTCTLNPTQVESTLNFNSNNTAVDTLITLDGLGRTRVQQKRQSPSSGNFDSAEADYDALSRPNRATLPYSGTSGQTNSSAPAVTTAYDALGRPTTVTDAGNGTVTYTYNQNDVLVTIGPAPTGESTKQRQLEYDSLGRLTSVCEITSASGSGACGQSSAQTGYWTKYGYDALGNLIGVTQNAQAGSTQTRSYSFDAMSRLTSETNPENGATTYTFDTDTNCGTSSGDLVKSVDAVGNTSCYAYDALHRVTSITYPSGAYSGSTPSKTFVYDSATVNGVAMSNVKGRLAEAYTGPSGAKTTDLGFSYTARGEVSDIYESTPHSGGYYHVSQTYWPHGAPSVLSATAGGVPITGFPAISYGGTIGSTAGLDGEGRITQVTASGTGQQNPVTGVTYNNSSLPTQVTFGSADTDIFAYDSHTMRMNSYQFSIGTQSVTGTLGWNANGSLGTFAISDPFNSANTQTCSYAADDLARINKADCGTIWGQTFSYDPFGNITKNKISGSNATSFTPTYQTSPVTNRVASVGGTSTTYDANGNSLNDTFRTYTWDADGNPVTIGSVTLTYDALDRMVEQTTGSANSEVVYGPGGGKLALMNGTSLIKAFVPLSGGATAVYNSGGLAYYRHSDHLGSSRLSSTPSQTVYSETAYSAFGEPYAQSGAIDPSFTGQNQDTTSGLYDFLYREYDPNQSRWTSPDPAGLAAVDLTNPQSWNRYSYVLNNPLAFVDPLGLVCVWDDGSYDAADDPQTGIQPLCEQLGGTWITDTMGGGWSPDPNADLAATVADLNSGLQGTLIQQDVWAPMPGDSGSDSGWAWTWNFTKSFVKGWFTQGLSDEPGSCTAVFLDSAANSPIVKPLRSLSMNLAKYGRSVAGGLGGLSTLPIQAKEVLGAMVAGGQLSPAVAAVGSNVVEGTVPVVAAAAPYVITVGGYSVAGGLDYVTGKALSDEVAAIRQGKCKP